MSPFNVDFDFCLQYVFIENLLHFHVSRLQKGSKLRQNMQGGTKEIILAREKLLEWILAFYWLLCTVFFL